MLTIEVGENESFKYWLSILSGLEKAGSIGIVSYSENQIIPPYSFPSLFETPEVPTLYICEIPVNNTRYP